MIAGEEVCVLRPVLGEPDAYGEPEVERWERQPVPCAIVAPSPTADLGPERPHGTSRGLTVHLPASVAGSLRGCRLEARGRLWDVVGDPEPYTEAGCPLPWVRPVEVEAVDG